MGNNEGKVESNKVAATKRKSSKMVLARSLAGVIAGLKEHSVISGEEEKVINAVREKLRGEIIKEM